MKQICTFLFSLLAFSSIAFSQMGSAKQVKWNFTAKKIADKKYEISMTAAINGDFHLYAINAGVEGPVPTTITFSPNPLITFQGKPTEKGKKITKYEAAWEGKVNYFEKTVTFTQVINTKTTANTNLNGKIAFMVCNDEVCLPPSEVPFKIAIGG
jgi:thiol:disulfide interchange protein DsbD